MGLPRIKKFKSLAECELAHVKRGFQVVTKTVKGVNISCFFKDNDTETITVTWEIIAEQVIATTVTETKKPE